MAHIEIKVGDGRYTKVNPFELMVEDSQREGYSVRGQQINSGAICNFVKSGFATASFNKVFMEYVRERIPICVRRYEEEEGLDFKMIHVDRIITALREYNREHYGQDVAMWVEDVNDYQYNYELTSQRGFDPHNGRIYAVKYRGIEPQLGRVLLPNVFGSSDQICFGNRGVEFNQLEGQLDQAVYAFNQYFQRNFNSDLSGISRDYYNDAGQGVTSVTDLADYSQMVEERAIELGVDADHLKHLLDCLYNGISMNALVPVFQCGILGIDFSAFH